ncbi:MAG: exodeoxyribonuclease VII large subunit, partial [Acidobacteriota bacterium]
VLERRAEDLLRIMNYRLLEERSRLQGLTMSPVFVETLQRANARLDAISAQLSPLRLASKVGDRKMTLGVLGQRSSSAITSSVEGKLKSLKISMAKLDALSPLAVLGRGFAIAENASGEILRDAALVTEQELIKIRLAKGTLRTRVELVDPTA